MFRNVRMAQVNLGGALRPAGIELQVGQEGFTGVSERWGVEGNRIRSI